MPGQLAALIVVLGILGLLLRDPARPAHASLALWLPCLWLCVSGSRFVSQWLSPYGAGSFDTGDGSPLDAAFFSLMLVAGIAVLVPRAQTVLRVLRDNPIVLAILVYALLSIAWSDFPVVSLKRYIKALGHPVMALIVVTDAAPGRALQLVLRRCAFVLLPLSILCIKYFPEIGRIFRPWSGTMYNQGVAITKNGLGATSLIFGVYFVWRILNFGPAQRARQAAPALWVDLGGLVSVLWLLWQADSATSTACFLVGGCVVLALRAACIRRHAAVGFATILPLVRSCSPPSRRHGSASSNC